MPAYRYLIVGGGMSADAAVQGIRQVDPDGSIGVISKETYPPYNRPPLSKGLWKGDSVEDIWRGSSAEQAQLHLATTIDSLDVNARRVMARSGEEFSYEKLLLATGGRVRTLPWDVEGIIYYRTFDDYQRLKALTEQGEHFAVIGGGFIGWEVAAALAMNGKRVTMIFPAETIGARIYPPRLAAFLNSYYESKGVRILANANATHAARNNSTYAVTTSTGETLRVDGVVAGIGIEPNVELAQAAGLKIGNGIIADSYLKTSHPDIYTAGDVANFYNSALDRRMRFEHEDNANDSGKIAGANMAGAQKRYDHLPFFYSDLFDLGYEAVGDLDSSLEVVEDWQEEFRTGVLYYLRDRRVRGVLLWNVWGKVDEARKLITDPQPVTATNLIGRIKP